ncbi:MAG: DoxX family protein [Planctomycetes bacterium]|nr:DoxX family protein [Planctomycetota bacterium]
MESNSKAFSWSGRALSWLLAAFLFVSASMKFVRPPGFEEGIAHIGWAASKATGIGVLEFACTVLYVIPRTAVLGAILLTGYLGGATATHVRVDDDVLVQPLLGVIAWLGLWLRDPRLRNVLPLS